MKREEVQFRCAEFVIRGELYLPDEAPATGILVCHAMHAEGYRWLPLYRLFAEGAALRGFACLLFDFRGCGRSEGAFDYGWSEQLDARAALDFMLSRKEIDPRAAFVVGRSLGGTVALHTFLEDSKVRGFALWATPPDHQENVRNFIVRRHGQLGYWMFLTLSFVDSFRNVGKVMNLDLFGLKLRPRDLRRKLMALKNSKLVSRTNVAPILLVIGEKDEYVTLREANEFEKNILGDRQLIVVPATGHTFKGMEEEVISATLAWFQNLTGSRRIS